MKNKLKNVLTTVLVLAFWLLVWQVLSLLVDNQYLLPGIPKTFSSLLTLLSTKKFYVAILSTLLRVIFGLLLGITFGILFGILSHYSKYVYKIISPAVSIIKATPVATFILLLYIALSGNALTVTIGFLMVMPIIWQNVFDAFNSIDKDLTEVCSVFEFTFLKKMKLLVMPTLLKFLVPATITATGLAWKSEIAAEIIAYTINSIGEGINDAKFNYDTASVFAWTVVIIILSIFLEKLAKFLLNKLKGGIRL